MHLSTPTILFSTLAHLAQPRALALPALPRRSCTTGQPGGVYIEVTTPHADADLITGKWFPPSQATQCLNQFQLGSTWPQWISFVGPDGGGNCLVYHSPDCAAGTGMPLENPDKVYLRYKNQIVCPGVRSDMLPRDWVSMRCWVEALN